MWPRSPRSRSNKDTGEIRVTRVCASHDCGEMVNPDGVANQVEGGVLQTVSRTLMEAVDLGPQHGEERRLGELPDHAPHRRRRKSRSR